MTAEPEFLVTRMSRQTTILAPSRTFRRPVSDRIFHRDIKRVAIHFCIVQRPFVLCIHETS
jgi:hypothetical protein